MAKLFAVEKPKNSDVALVFLEQYKTNLNGSSEKLSDAQKPILQEVIALLNDEIKLLEKDTKANKARLDELRKFKLTDKECGGTTDKQVLSFKDLAGNSVEDSSETENAIQGNKRKETKDKEGKDAKGKQKEVVVPTSEILKELDEYVKKPTTVADGFKLFRTAFLAYENASQPVKALAELKASSQTAQQPAISEGPVILGKLLPLKEYLDGILNHIYDFPPTKAAPKKAGSGASPKPDHQANLKTAEEALAAFKHLENLSLPLEKLFHPKNPSNNQIFARANENLTQKINDIRVVIIDSSLENRVNRSNAKDTTLIIKDFPNNVMKIYSDLVQGLPKDVNLSSLKGDNIDLVKEEINFLIGTTRGLIDKWKDNGKDKAALAADFEKLLKWTTEQYDGSSKCPVEDSVIKVLSGLHPPTYYKISFGIIANDFKLSASLSFKDRLAKFIAATKLYKNACLIKPDLPEIKTYLSMLKAECKAITEYLDNLAQETPKYTQPNDANICKKAAETLQVLKDQESNLSLKILLGEAAAGSKDAGISIFIPQFKALQDTKIKFQVSGQVIALKTATKEAATTKTGENVANLAKVLAEGLALTRSYLTVKGDLKACRDKLLAELKDVKTKLDEILVKVKTPTSWEEYSTLKEYIKSLDGLDTYRVGDLDDTNDITFLYPFAGKPGILQKFEFMREKCSDKLIVFRKDFTVDSSSIESIIKGIQHINQLIPEGKNLDTLAADRDSDVSKAAKSIQREAIAALTEFDKLIDEVVELNKSNAQEAKAQAEKMLKSIRSSSVVGAIRKALIYGGGEGFLFEEYQKLKRIAAQ